MGTATKTPSKEYFIFGTIQEEDRVIRINPALDQPFVPLWFLRYVLYHEMLHSVVPDQKLSANRRRVHTDEFNRREREFPQLPAGATLGRRKSVAFFALNRAVSALRSLASALAVHTTTVSLLRSF